MFSRDDPEHPRWVVGGNGGSSSLDRGLLKQFKDALISTPDTVFIAGSLRCLARASAQGYRGRGVAWRGA